MLTAGTDAYTYDANGNVSAKTTGGGAVTTFAYDFQNRITQITAPTASENSQYSPDGSRVFVSNAAIGGAIGPMYDTINPVLDMDAAGSVGIYRLYGPGIDEPLGEWRRVNNQTTFLHHDALNSVTAVSNISGTAIYRPNYTAFGERTQTAPPTGIVPTRFSYTSRENSVGSLMQYRNRYYDTATGRFATQDTYRGRVQQPPSLHRYGYAFNDPVRYVDPSGQLTLEEFFLCKGTHYTVEDVALAIFLVVLDVIVRGCPAVFGRPVRWAIAERTARDRDTAGKNDRRDSRVARIPLLVARADVAQPPRERKAVRFHQTRCRSQIRCLQLFGASGRYQRPGAGTRGSPPDEGITRQSVRVPSQP